MHMPVQPASLHHMVLGNDNHLRQWAWCNQAYNHVLCNCGRFDVHVQLYNFTYIFVYTYICIYDNNSINAASSVKIDFIAKYDVCNYAWFDAYLISGEDDRHLYEYGLILQSTVKWLFYEGTYVLYL